MRIVMLSLTGAVAGAVAAVIWGPAVIHWYAQPPFPMGCDCGAAINWAMNHLLMAQLYFVAGGAIVVPLIFGFLFRRRPKTEATTS
jgi:hypothetical protein